MTTVIRATHVGVTPHNTYSDEHVTLWHGDCLDVLADLPDASVDAVVTDPPYSLTDRREQYCASDVLRDAIVTDAQHSDAQRAQSLVALRVTVAPGLAMRVRGVNLDGDVSPRQEEVDDDGTAGRQVDDVLVYEGDAVTGEQRGGGEFRLWVRQGSTRCIGACRCLGQHGDGLIRIPVRLRHDAPGKAKRAPGIVALGGAELTAVLALDMAGWSGELLPASGADSIDPPFELLCPVSVGAGPRARRLTTVTEPGCVGTIGDSTDGTLSFDLLAHRTILSWRPTALRGFMSNLWDGTGIETDTRLWRECLRVLKPGGHLLAFGGTRTWHRLACAVEDAGFEVRDSIAWMYGSGFPKSLDVSKAIDKRRTEDREPMLRVRAWLNAQRIERGVSLGQINAFFGLATNGGGNASNWTQHPTSIAIPSWEKWLTLKDALDLPDDMDAEVWRLNGRKGKPGEAWQTAEVIGVREGAMAGWSMDGATKFVTREDKAANSDAAREWEGWGTALKPAFEPVVVARKPLIGTVAANVLAHGTGALNIDGCRIEHDEPEGRPSTGMHGRRAGIMGETIERHRETTSASTSGRWPANVVLDESQAEALDEQSGTLSHNPPATFVNGTAGAEGWGGIGKAEPGQARSGFGDAGGASRFFYVAKADATERPRVNGTAHPTVKPLSLMRWLVRLVTPPGGTVLEPFAGSGTTVEACIVEGFDCIAIEKGEEYLPLIMQRIHRRRDPVAAIRQTGDELGLFELDGEGA